jgi:hypothetical protein
VFFRLGCSAQLSFAVSQHQLLVLVLECFDMNGNSYYIHQALGPFTNATDACLAVCQSGYGLSEAICDLGATEYIHVSYDQYLHVRDRSRSADRCTRRLIGLCRLARCPKLGRSRSARRPSKRWLLEGHRVSIQMTRATAEFRLSEA